MREHALAVQLQLAITSPAFRVYVNDDLVGVELCAAAKNVIALAAGGADGLGLGDNARRRSSPAGSPRWAGSPRLPARGPETFAGLAGMGDLIVTCWSKSGRNRRCGELVAQGATPDGGGRRDRHGRRGADHGARAARPRAPARRRDADHRGRLRRSSTASRSTELVGALMRARPDRRVAAAAADVGSGAVALRLVWRAHVPASPPSRSPRGIRTRSPTRSRTPSSTRCSRDDPKGRVACETLITTGLVVVAGEITTETYVDIRALVREDGRRDRLHARQVRVRRRDVRRDRRDRRAVARHRAGRRRVLRGAARRRRPDRPDRRRRPGDDVRVRTRTRPRS